jgi:hypothetical protein
MATAVLELRKLSHFIVDCLLDAAIPALMECVVIYSGAFGNL